MEPTKIVKKRAIRACTACRARKVRCVVTRTTDACINCKLDGKECDSMRRIRMHSRNGQPSPDSESPSEQQSVMAGWDDSVLDPDSSETPQSSARPPAPDSETNKNMPASDGNCHDGQASTNPPTTAPGDPGTTSTATDGTSGASQSGSHPDYSFLKAPRLQDMLPQDVEFLNRQGCFIVPQRNVLDKFFRQYFLYVHPMLPILNEADFWAIYKSKRTNPQDHEKVSMLLLQGILFTSCGFVDQEAVEALGFSCIYDAKHTFYRRAKLLHDFGCERNSIAVAQAALLMSHSHLIPLPNESFQQLGSLWLGIALHHARDARAHCYYSMITGNSQPESEEKKKLYNTLKRLWWCCIICDRIMPLTSRLNIKISTSNFNFDSPMLSGADLSDEIYNSEVYDPATKLMLTQMLSKLVQLSTILTDVLIMTSLMHDNPSWAVSQRIRDMKHANVCKAQLDRWYNGLWEIKSTINPGIMRDMKDSETTNSPITSVILFSNLLEMYYHSARLSLCNYEILHLGLTSSALRLNHELSDLFEKKCEIQASVTRLTECLEELTRWRLTRWLPMSAIGCTAFPLAFHILDVEIFQSRQEGRNPLQGSKSVSREKEQKRLNILIEAMKTYRPRYYIANWVACTVRHIVGLAQQWVIATEAQQADSEQTVTSWTEMLQLQPSCYLRLVMTMDFSISNGKLPEETDFPPSLRGVAQGRITSMRIPRERFMGISAAVDKGSTRENSPGRTPIIERTIQEIDEDGNPIEETLEGGNNHNNNGHNDDYPSEEALFGDTGSVDATMDNSVFMRADEGQMDLQQTLRNMPPGPEMAMDMDTINNGLSYGYDHFPEWSEAIFDLIVPKPDLWIPPNFMSW